MPVVLQLAWFKRHYPHDYYRETYPTRDKVIPFKLFWLLSRASRSTMALERVSMAQAVVHAIGMAMKGDTPEIRRFAEREMKEVFGEE